MSASSFNIMPAGMESDEVILSDDPHLLLIFAFVFFFCRKTMMAFTKT